MFKVNNEDTRTVSLLLTLNIFHTFASFSIINFVFERIMFYQ